MSKKKKFKVSLDANGEDPTAWHRTRVPGATCLLFNSHVSLSGPIAIFLRDADEDPRAYDR
jgi:hypothetical protein